MDEFTAFIVIGGLVVLAIFLAIGKWYPGSGAEQVDWRLTRSPEVEAELEIDDVDQMIEAQNRRRRASGRREITEDDVRAQVAADERWREELKRRAREPGPAAGRLTWRGSCSWAAAAAAGRSPARSASTRCGGRRGRRSASRSSRRPASRGSWPIPTGSPRSCRALSGVTIVCWLMGTAPDAPDVHGDRLRTLTEHLVDTPVRGLVYEAAGHRRPRAPLAGRANRARGVAYVAHSGGGGGRRTRAAQDGWTAAMKAAIERLLAG